MGDEGRGKRLGVHGGERKIALRWMYATSRFLLLPGYRRRGLLDAGDEVARGFFFEWRHELHARDVLGRMMTTGMKYAPCGRIGGRRDVSLKDDPLLSRFGVGHGNR